MSAISCIGCGFSSGLVHNRSGFGHVAGINRTVSTTTASKVSRPFQDRIFHTYPLAFTRLKMVAKIPNVRMTSIDERLAGGRDVVKPSEILAYDLVQGARSMSNDYLIGWMKSLVGQGWNLRCKSQFRCRQPSVRP